MSKLLSLLKAAVSEMALGSRLGQWRLAVSKAIDGRSAKYVIVGNDAHAQNIADLSGGEKIILETILVDQGVEYDPTTGAFTLEPNSFYELIFFAKYDTFNTVATDYAYSFWASSSGQALVAYTGALSFPPASTLNLSGEPVSKLLYGTGAAAEDVYLWTAGGDGAASVSLRAYAIVRRIAKA